MGGGGVNGRRCGRRGLTPYPPTHRGVPARSAYPLPPYRFAMPLPYPTRHLSQIQDARDAETHGWAVLSRVGVMACEYSFIVLGLTSQRSSSEFRRIRVEILGLTYLGVIRFLDVSRGCTWHAYARRES